MERLLQAAVESPFVKSALREDIAGFGIPLPTALSARMNRLCGRSRRLNAKWSVPCEEEFGRRLSRVRLFAGEEVDRFAEEFQAAAFCVGENVFLGKAAFLQGNGDPDPDILRHELAHIAHRVEPDRIRFWDREVHAELTEKACSAFSSAFGALVKIKNININKSDLIQGLKTASSNMDYRKRVVYVNYAPELAQSAWSKFSNWFGSGTGISLGSPGIAGEGPRHGEGKNYKSTDWSINQKANLAEQNSHIDIAIEEYQSDKESWIDDLIPTARTNFMAFNEKPWIKSLGNALHVAQDRGSHREGVKGFGHDDPRTSIAPAWTAWNPDKPIHDHSMGGSWKRCSWAAYQKSLNNSCDVLLRFFQGIAIQASAPQLSSTDCMAVKCDIFFSPYPNQTNQSVLGRHARISGQVHSQLGLSAVPIRKALDVSTNAPIGRYP